MNSDAIAKIKMLKSSLRCFAFGLLGLAPLLGLPLVFLILWMSDSVEFRTYAVCLLMFLAMVALVFALPALWISGRVYVAEKIFWNAAKPYRLWGLVCATVGTIFWSGVMLFILFQVLMTARWFN